MKFKEIAKDRFLILSIAYLLIVVLPLEIFSFFNVHLPILLELFVFVITLIAFGKETILSGLRSLLRLNFADINLLMTIAIVGAVFLREFDEAAIVVLLFAIGNRLEDFGFSAAKKNIEELISKAPDMTRRKDGKRVSTEKIRVGDIIVIKPGERIPLDGKVVKGRSFIDESIITGESLPKDKIKGDMVFAGSMNGTGYLEVKVSKIFGETTLSKIIGLTKAASKNKSQAELFIQRFARFYTPCIIFITLMMVVVPVVIFKQDFLHWFKNALILLVISCPCALVLSTPVTVFSAVGAASKKGVLIKGGRFIEELAKTKIIAMDKTRTITQGTIAVTDVIALNGFTQEDVLACAAGIEAFSEHPIAESITQSAKEKGITAHSFKSASTKLGKGMQGECTVCIDKHHCLGTLKFVSEEHHVDKKTIRTMEDLQKQGKTVMIITDKKKIKGLIAVSDTIKENSKGTITALNELGLKTIMLSGDNQLAANAIGERIGINEIHAELLPEDKAAVITQLSKKFRPVAMVGDGINDAPALATADVGIAMGAAGSDTAIETADIVIMNDKISTLPFLIRLSRACVLKIRINVFLALTAKLAILVLALAGIANLGLAIFADVGITAIVIINGLSINSYS
ncbi:MAG: cation-translocating P-type ATPase [Nanoarchaeota archaeon]